MSYAREEANDREVYVGGLPGTTTEADLRRFIQQHVPDVRVAGVHLVRNNRSRHAGWSVSIGAGFSASSDHPDRGWPPRCWIGQCAFARRG